MSKTEAYFETPETERGISRLEEMRADVSNYLEALVSFCQGYDWLPQIDNLAKVTALTITNRNEDGDRYYGETAEVSYVRDFPNVHSVVSVEVHGWTASWSGEPEKQGSRAEIRIYNHYRFEMGLIGSTMALNLAFLKVSDTYCMSGMQLQISPQGNSPFTVYIKIRENGEKRVTLSAQTPSMMGGSFDVFHDGRWAIKYQKELSKLGISDRVIEAFTFESLLELGNNMAEGRIVGNKFSEIQTQANGILSRKPRG